MVEWRRGLALAAFSAVLCGIPAPALMFELDLERRIALAGWIVEGRVVDSTPFMEPRSRMIFTEHRIVVSRRHKAPTDAAELLIITRGGRLGDERHEVFPALELAPGDEGMFFLESRSDYAGRNAALVPVGAPQGFVRFRADAPGGAVAFDPFRSYADLDRDLRLPVLQQLGQPLRLELDESSDRPDDINRLGTPTITNLSPSTVRAGVRELLVIEGSGFGTQTGSAAVFFDNADDGVGGSFGGASSNHIQSWTDTRIEVLVPSSGVAAGTGRVIVRDAAGNDAVSPSDLTVLWGITEVNSGDIRRLRYQNQDGAGGYTFQYSTATSNNGVAFNTATDAVARFESALDLWNCSARWNARASGTTPVNSTGSDGVNIVAFDNDADPLPAGVLGRASSFFSTCAADSWHVTGIDIRFKRDGSGVDWYFGADPSGIAFSEFDFESVALHELGHAALHKHNNDNTQVMYFQILNSQISRSLSAQDIDGVDNALTFSAGFADCGVTEMLPFDCLAPPSANFSGTPRGACGTNATVQYTDLSLNAPTAWAWTFGDGGQATTASPSWDYTSPGIYDVSLTVTNANGSDSLTRENYIVVTADPTTASCNPSFTGHDAGFGVGIRQVTVGGIDRASGTPTDGDALEEDRTCSDFAVLDAEVAAPITIETGLFNDEDVRVYVDWNNDGVLAAAELSFSSDAARTHSGTITPPASATRGTALRMRVLSDFFGTDAIDSACENIEFGQVENYSVLVPQTVVAAPGAVPETSLRITRVAGASDIDLSWGASCSSGATDYSIHEGTLGNWYSHSSVVCSTSGATSWSGLTPAGTAQYYLIVPTTTAAEGSYGLSGAGTERPVSTTVCLVSQDTTTCP